MNPIAGYPEISPLQRRFRVRLLDVMVILPIVLYAGWIGIRRPNVPAEPSTFSKSLDLSPLHRVAVQADGRLRSFESHARTFMGFVTGPREIGGQSHGFTYLDLLFRPEEYTDRAIVFVKNKGVRAQILQTLLAGGRLDAQSSAIIRDTGLFAPKLFHDPAVVALLQKLGQDLIRTAKPVDAIQTALGVSNSMVLEQNLRFVPPRAATKSPSALGVSNSMVLEQNLRSVPPRAATESPWISPMELAAATQEPAADASVVDRAKQRTSGIPPEIQGMLSSSWAALRAAWRAENAAEANVQIVKLAGMLPGIAPDAYPSPGRLAMESWYFRNKSMTWVWWLYAVAVVPLLLSVIYGWSGARKIAMVLFVLAFMGHTASLAIRWYISGRWPNSNMFEAVHTSAWLGGAVALVLEFLTRRKPVRSLFALGSSVVSMTALMAAYFLPAHLDSTINNKMAALNDVWLYIHTNMIILSYALIGVACVTALLFLRHRWCRAWDGETVPRLRLAVVPIAIAVSNWTGYLLLMHFIDSDNRGLAGLKSVATAAAFVASLAVLVLELWEATVRSAGAPFERASSGGASSLLLASTPRNRFLTPAAPASGEVLDAATMVILELSFLTLWTGIVMGAIWADHSWGRPWGWDPKEVFALNTFFIFLILVHVRLKVRDKAFWTAVLAVVGFEVMMFNWIVVNFIITGLHSYA